MIHRNTGPLLLLGGVILTSVLIVIVPSFFSSSLGRIELNTPIELPKVLNGQKRTALIFFGYAGCSDICTPRLQALARLYESLDEEVQSDLEIEFFDISRPYDTALPMRFASYFHPNFIGHYLSASEIKEYGRIFEVYFSHKLMDTTEYDHSTKLYLVHKDRSGAKRVRFIYNTYPYSEHIISNDIRSLLNE